MDYTANDRDDLNKFTVGHIENMLIIQMAKIELIGGHIGFILIIEITKLDYTKYTHCLNRINWRPY